MALPNVTSAIISAIFYTLTLSAMSIVLYYADLKTARCYIDKVLTCCMKIYLRVFNAPC